MTTPNTEQKPKHRGYLEYGPLLLFFGINYIYKDIMLATAVLIGSTLVALGFSWTLDKRIPKLAVFGCIAVALFGGLTLYFQDDWFIKIKPTVISGGLALFLAGGQLINKAPLKALLGQQMRLSDVGWRQVTWVWAAMFAVSAVANEIAWRLLSTNDWVTFKAFGLTGISIAFALMTMPIISKHSLDGKHR